jgi:hypothetical protein
MGRYVTVSSDQSMVAQQVMGRATRLNPQDVQTYGMSGTKGPK